MGRILFRSCSELADQLQPKERIISISFQMIIAMICSRVSYREAVELLNQMYHRSSNNTLKLRTFSDYVQRMGTEVSDAIEGLSQNILDHAGFDPETGLPRPETVLSSEMTGVNAVGNLCFSENKVQTAIREYNEAEKNGIKINLPTEVITEQLKYDSEHSVLISIDDIGVKRQKDKRGDGSVRKTKTVQNTVAHIQFDNISYRITAYGMKKTLMEVLAFLTQNNLLRYNLVFITDGAKDIKSHIESIFGFHTYRTILDWYHLGKKTRELISMGIQGKNNSGAVSQSLLQMLWVGDVAGAVDFVHSLPQKIIKSRCRLEEYISYLERKKESIVCYAIRKHLGLRCSSNPVEKSNDILIAERQKHNGMSWTPKGSTSLASIEMIIGNDQAALWFYSKRICGFSSPIFSEEKCA